MNEKRLAELAALQSRRQAIRNDLDTLVDSLSPISTVVLMMHLAMLEADIKKLTDEMESTGFEDFMRKAWGG